MKRSAYAALGWAVWNIGRPLLRRRRARARDQQDADHITGPLAKTTERLKRTTRSRRRSKAAKKAARTRKRKGSRR